MAEVTTKAGLALTALARGLAVHDDPELRGIARRLAATLLSARRRDGTLPRTLAPQSIIKIVDDHAFVAAGLLAALGAPGVDSAQARETLVRASAYLVDGGGGQHFSSLVRALALLQRGWLELVVVGDPASVQARALVAVHTATRWPGLVLGEASEAGLPAGWFAFAGQSAGQSVSAEGARAHLCRDGECEAPTADPHMLRTLLARSFWPLPVKR